MEKLNSIPILGKWNDIAGKLNDNLQKIEQEMIKLGYSTYKSTKFKGYYPNYTSLLNAFPTPDVGDWAFVGKDELIYQYANEDDGAFWEEGASISAVFNINLSNYLTTTDDLSNNVIGDENLLDVLNAKLTSNSILPFDGVLESSVTLSQVSISEPYRIYYSTQLDMFVARDLGDRDGSYTTTFLGEGTTYLSTKYNVNNVADKTKLYVDTNGSVYAFENNQLTKVVGFNNGFTENPVANLAIKELYLQGLAEDESYYIHAIFRNYYEESISMYKCQISIMDSSGTLVAQYYDQTADMHKPNSLITFTTQNSSGVSGNAVIDWDSVIEESRWFLSTYDGKAFITQKAKELSFSPTIYATLNSGSSNSVLYTEQSLTEEQQAQARVNIGVEDVDGYTLIPNSGVVDSSNMKVAFPTASEEVQSDADVVLESKTPSGDPMHNTYVAAGAVWNTTTKTWSANGRTGLSNADIRSLYNSGDMEELLFRKLWNSCNALTYENNKVKYDEHTGFYRANGVWHIEYGEALEIFAKNPYARMGMGTSSTGLNYSPITTLPMMSSAGGTTLYYEFVWQKRIVDLRMICYDGGKNGVDNINKTSATGYSYSIGYCYNIRIIRDMIMNQTPRPGEFFTLMDRCNSLTHFMVCNRVNTTNGFNFSKVQRMSYFSILHFLNRTTVGCTIILHPDVYSYITGTTNPEEMGMSPVIPEYSTYYYIPYQQNLKILPDNAFWREELDVKGANGEYVYPSFAEYLSANPDRFATAADWQALATLAEEKGITITTA